MTAGIFGINSGIIIALILTIVIESLIYFIWFRKDFMETFYYCSLINLLTVPLANFSYGIMFLRENFFGIILIEFLVILAESLLIMTLFRIKWWKALILSLTANIVSTILGFFVTLSILYFY